VQLFSTGTLLLPKRGVFKIEHMFLFVTRKTLAKTISCNGNILINVGPTKSGTIPIAFEERLRQMGAWLGVNGEAVYGSKPWKQANDSSTSDVWYVV